MNDVNASALDRETKLFATIERLQAENVRLRAELARIKPSWDDAPKNAVALAMNENGRWLFHARIPEPEVEDSGWGFWYSNISWRNMDYHLPFKMKHWRETLERRPEDK